MFKVLTILKKSKKKQIIEKRNVNKEDESCLKNGTMC